MDYMREGIGLRAMAQKDPLIEYRNEGHDMFQDLRRAIREEVIALLYHLQVEPGDAAVAPEQPQQANGGALHFEHQTLAGSEAIAAAGQPAGVPAAGNGGNGSAPLAPVVKSEQESIGRNDPCWCGSGKKYKRCHGA
jgi:preprotein translocase subunit SecA